MRILRSGVCIYLIIPIFVKKTMVNTQTYCLPEVFKTESGALIQNLEIAYTTSGKINSESTNVVWICHAFTADAHPENWWSDMVGKGRFFSPDKYFIICANIIGSPYGTTSPLSNNPSTGKPYYRDFPELTVRDLATAHIFLAKHLNIKNIRLLIGGSIGGHQALEWAIMLPQMIHHLVMLASSAETSPCRRAHNTTQRMIIEADASFFSDTSKGGENGMKAARAMALLGYRNAKIYALTQSEENEDKLNHFKVDSYQRYQGDKLAKRFNAYSYYTLLKMLDTHNVGRNRGGVEKALQQIQAKTLIIGIQSDIMFWPEDQEKMHHAIPNSKLIMIESDFGHDGFLLENEKISTKIAVFLDHV